MTKSIRPPCSIISLPHTPQSPASSDSPISGLTPRIDTARRMAVVCGAHAVVTPDVHSMTEAVSRAIRVVLMEGFAVSGEEIEVTAGVPFGLAGTTNALRVATLK